MKKIALPLFASALVICGALFFLGFFIPKGEQIKQDVWDIGEGDPEGYLVFYFTSSGGFFANYPIHVKIQVWITAGKNYSDIVVVFPDAYVYPRNQTPGNPPAAAEIPISEDGDRIGEGYMEFTSSGSFGYIIFSRGQPVYYAANIQIIQVSPYENRVQLDLANKGVGITLAALGITLIGLPILKHKKKKPSELQVRNPATKRGRKYQK